METTTNLNPENLVSSPISLQGVPNCRDLGGIETISGQKIKNGLLIRSSDLHGATLSDLELLERLGIRNDVDLRTEWEILAAPDKVGKGWKVDHLPVIHESQIAGLEGSALKTAEDFLSNAKAVITKLYPQLLLGKRAIKTWKAFFDLLLTTEEGTIFHCTEGKDRTGIAAILIEAALGVEEEKILKDYLETNLFVNGIIAHDESIAAKDPFERKKTEEAVFYFLKAEPEYFEAAKQAVKPYGGWIGYLKEVIGLSDQQLETLKEKYLEKKDA